MGVMIRALLAIAICASLCTADGPPRKCPDLDDPRYGDVKVTGNHPRDKAFYRCDKGFQLVGNQARKCQSNGYWTGKDPICKRIPRKCPDLDDPRYGDVKMTGNHPGDKAFYRCDKGFQLVGNQARKCQSNGYWTGKDPICKRIPRKCPDLDDPRYGDVKVTGNHPGDKAFYRCDKGFQLVGNQARKCQSNGYWTGSDPICKRAKRPCPRPKRPKYGYVRYRSTSHGSTAYFFCYRGYTLDGSSSSNCNNGYWTDATPKCLKKH